MSAEFYKNLYTNEDSIHCDFEKIPNRFPKLQDSLLMDIQREVNDDDIKYVVYSIKGMKAPGPDGIHGLFIQNQWKRVGGTVCNFVRNVLLEPERISEVNETLIALIPKVDHPKSVKEFRPIALCNVIYKVVTKIIANRLKDHMDYLVGKN